ncbi:MAG: PAS domain S-box protein [Gemmatimonadota bacterium]
MISSSVAALGRVAHLLAGAPDAAGAMTAAAEEGMRVFGAQRAGIFLIDEQHSSVEAPVAIGLSQAYVDSVRTRFREAHSSSSVLRGEPYFQPDARQDFSSPIHDVVLAEGFAGVAALPLSYEERVIGWLAFYHDGPREYSPDERILASAFADQASLAIGMRRLLETLVRVKTEWQTAFDGTGSGLALVDADGHIERANRFVAEIAGVNVTDLPGLRLTTLFSHWPAQEQDPLDQARQRGHRVSSFLDAASGHHLVLTAAPRPDGGFVVALDDLTHYVRLEARYSRLVETAQEAIVLSGADGRVLFANAAAAELFGVPAVHLLGAALSSLLPEEAGQVSPVSTASPRRYEALVRRADGMRIADVSVAPLEERGTPAGSVAVARDVTRERLAAEALRRSERRFRALFNRAPLAIVTLGRDGRFLSVNRAGFLLAGLTAPTPAARLANFVAPSDWPRVEAELGRSFRGENRHFMFQLRRSDAVLRQAEAVVVPVEERGGLRALLAIVRDVTDEIELRERLTHSEKMVALGGLVSGAAHELNNPLAGIAAMAQAMLIDPDLPVEVASGIETMRQEAMRAGRIVTGLLTFARLRPLERRDTQLNLITRETFAATPALSEHGVVWTLGLDPTLPTVSGDPDQIRQVVTNLLMNAAHAMAGSDPRTATVRTWSDRDWVGFEVLDSGGGIPEGALSRVFEPFFTTKAQGHGTGLGLSISHGIIRAHGGEIRGENRPEGGARFAFRLPRDPTRIGRTGHA